MAARFGPYEIVEPPLGQGGMGVVYRARHTVLGTWACVKQLLPEYTRNQHVVERFINEARAAATLDHEHVVGVLDCNQTSEGAWYIVLEFLEGVPLSKWLKGRTRHRVEPRIQTGDGSGATDVVQIARILLPVAGALHTAHGAGIVHRDVKPDNIMLVARRSGGEENRLHPVLLDFGIAKMRAEQGGGVTGSGAYLGTMAYMAPEQFGSAKHADRRTDVYALGGVLYQMVTGGFYAWANANNEVPSPEQLYYRQVTEPPPDPRGRNPAVSPAMASLVRWALTCDPVDRCPSALVFGEQLAAIVAAGGQLQGSHEFLRSWIPSAPVGAAAATAPGLVGPSADLSGDDVWRPPASAISNGVPSEIVARPEEATRRVRPPPLEDAGTSLDPAGEISTPIPAVMKTPMMAAAVVEPPSQRTVKRAGRRARPVIAGGVAAGAVALAVGVIVGFGLISDRSPHGGRGSVDGGARTSIAHGPGSVQDAAYADAPSSSVSAATPAAPEVPVAVLTEPADAAVFIDDDLLGTTPTKATLAVGRTVRIRAELPGHVPSETSYVVVDRPDTVRLVLAPLAGRPGGRPTRVKPREGEAVRRPDAGVPQGPDRFDPERLGE